MIALSAFLVGGAALGAAVRPGLARPRLPGSSGYKEAARETKERAVGHSGEEDAEMQKRGRNACRNKAKHQFNVHWTRYYGASPSPGYLLKVGAEQRALL